MYSIHSLTVQLEEAEFSISPFTFVKYDYVSKSNRKIISIGKGEETKKMGSFLTANVGEA